MGRGCGGRGLGVGSSASGKSEQAPDRKELGLLLPRLLLSSWEKWLSLGGWGGEFGEEWQRGAEEEMTEGEDTEISNLEAFRGDAAQGWTRAT